MGETPDVYLMEHLREALAKDPRVNELELDVTRTGDQVFVNGTVSTDERREAVTRVLRELCPDLEVVNETSVLTVGSRPEQERIS